MIEYGINTGEAGLHVFGPVTLGFPSRDYMGKTKLPVTRSERMRSYWGKNLSSTGNITPVNHCKGHNVIIREKTRTAADPKTHEPYTIAKDGFRSTFYEMVGQYGTHVDPPAHFAETGITMDRIPLKEMILPLIVLDDTPYLAKDPNHAFSVDDLMAWERQHGPVPKGAFVALRTDMYKDWDANPERFKRSPFPAWAFETIKFLYERRGVTATGHESMDTDTTDKMDSETYILQHGHYQIEVMANLDKVPATGALIVVSWPKVRDGLGFPARAFAILP